MTINGLVISIHGVWKQFMCMYQGTECSMAGKTGQADSGDAVHVQAVQM